MTDNFDTFESCPVCLGIGEDLLGNPCVYCGGSGNGLEEEFTREEPLILFDEFLENEDE